MNIAPLHVFAQNASWFLFAMMLVVCFALWRAYKEDQNEGQD